MCNHPITAGDNYCETCQVCGAVLSVREGQGQRQEDSLDEEMRKCEAKLEKLIKTFNGILKELEKITKEKGNKNEKNN